MFDRLKRKVTGTKSENHKRKERDVLELRAKYGELLDQVGNSYSGPIDDMRAKINAVDDPKKPGNLTSKNVVELKDQFGEFKKLLLSAKKKNEELKEEKEKKESAKQLEREQERKDADKKHQVNMVKARSKLQLHFMDDFAGLEMVHIVRGFRGKNIERDIFNELRTFKEIAYSIGKLDDLIREFILGFLPLEKNYQKLLNEIDGISLLEAEDLYKTKIEAFRQEFQPRLAKLRLLGIKIESYHKLRTELYEADCHHVRGQALFTPIDADHLEDDHPVLGTDGYYYTERYFKVSPAKEEKDVSDKLKAGATQTNITPCEEFKAIYGIYKSRRIDILRRIEELKKCQDLKTHGEATFHIKVLLGEHRQFEWDKLYHHAGFRSWARYEYLQTKQELKNKYFLDSNNSSHLQYWQDSLKHNSGSSGFVTMQCDIGFLTTQIKSYTMPSIIHARMNTIMHIDFLDADALIKALNEPLKRAKLTRYSFVAQMAKGVSVDEMKVALSQEFVKPKIR